MSRLYSVLKRFQWSKEAHNAIKTKIFKSTYFVKVQWKN